MLCGFALAEGEFPELNEKGFLDEGEWVSSVIYINSWRVVINNIEL